MANSNVVSSTSPSRDYHCKICDLFLDTHDSLEVHLQYHKENLYIKWGAQNLHNDTENNNGMKVKNDSTVSAPADSSDTMITKSSSELGQRGTPAPPAPETAASAHFTHPATPHTPHSLHSAPSPYQNTDMTSFSPGHQFANTYTNSGFPSNQHSEQTNWEQSQYSQDYHKPNRFHPYNMQERTPRVSSSSPYGQPLNQPTPSPSPKQCDKCGFVCDSATQLNEHCNSAHSAATQGPPPFKQFPGKQYSNMAYQNEFKVKVKEEHEESSDILDLDSQKVVYQGNEGDQPNPTYEEGSTHGREANPRTVPIMPWETQKLYSNQPSNGDLSLFKDQNGFGDQKSYPADIKIFQPDQKFQYGQDKFHSVQDQKPFMHIEQKLYPGIQMPPLTDYAGQAASSNADLKPSYRPYDSPDMPQITSTQPANPTSSALPSIGGKGANWKSNEARRPKTYNCTACNKWFTSSGHLKRHYNTTLHKNAVRSSGQPDPASMPISSHHHPSRDSMRGQQQVTVSNTQSPISSSEEGRSIDDAALQSSYASGNFDRSHRLAAMQSKSPYTQLQQGNLDNNFSNNPLANHPLQHQVGSHSDQPPGIGNPNDSNHQGSNGVAISSAGNPPNAEAGPSVSQNHDMRGLLSVSTSNISTQGLTTPALTPHTLPPFSHLAANPYNPMSTDPLGPSAQDPTHIPLYLGQNFQQTIAPNYPNGTAPHVMDMATNNLPTASPATFGESSSEEVEIMEQETSEPAGVRLPSFAQLQTSSFSVYVSNYVSPPNVGGQVIADDSTAGYIIVDGVHSPMKYSHNQTMDDDYNFSVRTVKENVVNYTAEPVKVYPCYYTVDGKPIKRRDEMRYESNELQMIKIEDIMDYTNKENNGNQMISPASPESATADNESRSSPAVSSTVSTPLVERNQLKKSAPTTIHKCYECDKLFNKACYLTQHNKTFHSGDKPFKCERCGKRFPDDVSYEGHYVKHADNKPFKCTECPKSFNHKTDLRRHMCLHSGCKPFSCDHCGKGFIRKDHMVKHYDTHIKKNLRTSSSSISSTTSPTSMS